MSEKPMIFSGPMVRAILAGRKTETRRIFKPLSKRHPIVNLAQFDAAYSGRFNDPGSWGFAYAEDGNHMPLSFWPELSGYAPGDRLWVREIVHMPRRASRLTLIVEAVEVERLQDMNRGDAMAEGCPFPNMAKGDNPLHWFRYLWDSTNASRPGCAWDDNPWVAAVSFCTINANIDAIGQVQ